MTQDKGLGSKTNFARLCWAFVLALALLSLPFPSPHSCVGRHSAPLHEIPSTKSFPSTRISFCKAFSPGMVTWQPLCTWCPGNHSLLTGVIKKGQVLRQVCFGGRPRTRSASCIPQCYHKPGRSDLRGDTIHYFFFLCV